MATSAQTCSLPVDPSGVPITSVLAGRSDRDAAAAARDAIDALLGVRISVVAAASTADHGEPERHEHGAVVTVREVTDSGVAYRTAAATATSGGEAVARAVLDAFAVEGSFVEPAAARWVREADVRSVTIVRGDEPRPIGDTDESALHCRLLATMPGPGVLAVDAVDAAYRVVRLPDVAVACTLATNARVASRFDTWARALQERVRT
jgi:hypothetical protein